MSFIEQKIEDTIRTGLQTALTDAGLTDVDIRTFFAEPAYVSGDERMSLPIVWLMTSPCTKPVGSEPFRVASLQIDMRTHYNDDYDRNTLSEIYRVIRKCIEETAWDFGTGMIVHEYEMNSQGTADIDDNLQNISMNIDFKLCATDFDL